MKSVPDGDARLLVMRGYDAIAPAYAAERRRGTPELEALFARVRNGSRVLDLGCGAGVPVAAALAARYELVGLDLSAGQLAAARKNVPAMSVVRGDMTTCAFRARSFDAVVSLYAIFHTPRETHAALIARIATWLRPGGCLMASFAREDEAPYTEDFLGTDMYWSNWGIARYRQLLAAVGFDIVEEGMLPHGFSPAGEQAEERHPVVVARLAV